MRADFEAKKNEDWCGPSLLPALSSMHVACQTIAFSVTLESKGSAYCWQISAIFRSVGPGLVDREVEFLHRVGRCMKLDAMMWY